MRNNLLANRNINESNKQAIRHDIWNKLADSSKADEAKPNVVQ